MHRPFELPVGTSALIGMKSGTCSPRRDGEAKTRVGVPADPDPAVQHERGRIEPTVPITRRGDCTPPGMMASGHHSGYQAAGRMNPHIATKWTTEAVRTNPCHTAEYQTQFFSRWNRTPTV